MWSQELNFMISMGPFQPGFSMIIIKMLLFQSMQEEYKAKTKWKGREKEDWKETGTNNEKQVGKIEAMYTKTSDPKFNEAATIISWNICFFFCVGIPIVLVMNKLHNKLPNSMAGVSLF